MSDGNWDEVLSAYKYAQKESWGEDLVWMEKLASCLMKNRDLSMLYPITSHYRSLTYISKDFEGVYDKPIVSIELSNEQREHIKDKFRFKFSLTTGSEDGDLFRENVESIFCSFERSLEVFDEMIKKLEKISK